jgi:hypothetical protein
MATCRLYKPNGALLGSGSINNGAVTVSGWTAQSGTPPIARRNIAVTITSSTHTGSTFHTKVMTDNGGSLTLRDPSPFAT